MCRSVLLSCVAALAGRVSAGNVPPVACPAFTCSTAGSSAPADSVHKLRPSDVKVVAAFGDSLTAAFGAGASTLEGEFGELLEYRQYSWSAGGDASYTTACTLPNIIRMFSNRTSGAATGNTWVPLSADRSQEGLDVAVSGSLASDFESQANRMVADMGKRSDVNVTGDWKVATVFTGGNDLCAICYSSSDDVQAAYMSSLEKGLDILLAKVPRLLVNLVSEVDVSLLSLMESTAHDLECPCIGRGKDALKKMHDAGLLYQEAMHKVAALPRYQARDDWTVVVQTMYEGFVFPTTSSGAPDVSFFSPDRFHYSTKGHAAAAIGLWNNMLQPVGKKSTWSRDFISSVMCPSKERPYFATSKNSVGLGIVEGER